MTSKDRKAIEKVLCEYLADENVQSMKKFTQHGSVSTYDHCLNVVKLCYYFDKNLKLGLDLDTLLVAALLHDFYLYDWHEKGAGEGLHGFTHPAVAAEKAREHFDVDERVQDAIRSHMWPLTLRAVPKSKEAALLCISDKLVSAVETIWMR